MQSRYRVALLGALLVLVAGCFPDSTPPSDPAPPASCGNGSCEPTKEDCNVCPEDCTCCAIVDSRGTIPLEEAMRVNGSPDGNSAQLDENSELTLSFGREVFDYFMPSDPERVVIKADFTIHGQVTSTNALETVETCSRVSGDQQQGVFAVLASPDGITWSTIGIWARTTDGGQNNQFDIACAELQQAKYIRIQASPGATAEIDAITAVIDDDGLSCQEAQSP